MRYMAVDPRGPAPASGYTITKWTMPDAAQATPASSAASPLHLIRSEDFINLLLSSSWVEI
jgi:hypothetical protein